MTFIYSNYAEEIKRHKIEETVRNERLRKDISRTVQYFCLEFSQEIEINSCGGLNREFLKNIIGCHGNRENAFPSLQDRKI